MGNEWMDGWMDGWEGGREAWGGFLVGVGVGWVFWWGVDG